MQYAPGETITGKVTMRLKKPTQANGLSITLRAQQDRNLGMNRQTHQQQDSIVTLFNFAVPLAGAQEYSEGEWPFVIKVPEGVAPQGGAPGLSVTFSLSGVGLGGNAGPIIWSLEAHLDIPGAFDMRKELQLNIG